MGAKWAVAAGLSGLAVAALFGLRHPPPVDPTLRTVELPGGSSLLVMKREVTRREWKACADAGACENLTGNIPASEPDKPMTGVNRFDVDAYIAWRNAEGGYNYRLPTVAEWNAIAAALPRKPYRKLFDDPRLAWAADYGAMEKVSAVVEPSGSFGMLANGIADLGGNVWEWTASCAKEGISDTHCPAYSVEGSHQSALSVFVREPATGGCAAGTPPANIGFRLMAED